MRLRVVLAALAALFVCGAAFAQLSSPFSYLSAATTNSTLVRAGGGQVAGLVLANTTATIYYFKLYDKATAPTCGTDTPVHRIPVPASATASGFVIPFTVPLSFVRGIGFCLTAGIADNDTGAAATGVAINLAVR